MELQGIHHITAITGDAPGNVDFYVRVLGLRLVKKTVNFDAPDVYHLYYGDERGNPGSIVTFFEFPGAAPGQAGAGMIHRLLWRVRSAEALDFWAQRLSAEGIEPDRSEGRLTATDPEGLGLELVVDDSDEPLTAFGPEIPEEHALTGFHGVRAFAGHPEASSPLLTGVMGATAEGEGAFALTGGARSAVYLLEPTQCAGVQGAGTVHHIAWACRPEDQQRWKERVGQGGAHVTDILDRTYFRSIYFREPSGVLFEIATMGPGFDFDEPLERLGERLCLPPQYEGMRARLERTLTPLTDPRRESVP